ncbi:helix-turn-helix transcriptional regulator [Robiginitalea sp. SC105]|uniref:ArsR/SmtB family transcription factor n=1 Tax=Robiginitalea sp. SC105 TaxID=2762332 RepID=UPI00163A11D1|nr:metalloregulator ArsR/SmtB family transcription factor [Robiginitalea sp. SC105]MBC2840535.1 winged helix-turn-helix transcriptional regulator [Robiginitalea sp. SC105]
MDLRRDVFQGIADPTRREILKIIAPEAMASGEIALHFDSARQTISRHLKILLECGLLDQKRQGREILYSLNPGKVREIADFIQPLRQYWDDRANTLEELMKYYD